MLALEGICLLGLGRGNDLLDPVLALLDVEPLPVPALLDDSFLGGLLLGGGVGADGSVGSFVEGGELGGFNAVLDVLGEARFVFFGLLGLEGVHVFRNMLTENALLKDFGREFLGFSVITGEALFVVGDLKSTVNSSLHDGENTGTSGGAAKTNIKIAVEWARSIINLLNLKHLTIGILLSNVLGVQLKLVKETASAEETNAIRRSVVGQSSLNSVPGELMSIGSGEDVISLNLSSNDLAGNVAVGETNNEPVLGAVVLVFVLGDQPLAGTVVGLSFAPTPVFNLVALEVSLVLNNLDESLNSQIRNFFWRERKIF